MKMNEFINRVKSLRHIDGHQVPELSEADQQRFMRAPLQFFLNADDRIQTAIWREIEVRQK